MSLVLVSPSTESWSQVRAAARAEQRWSVAGSAVASVSTTESIVAIRGWIIPTPLQMPVTVTVDRRAAVGGGQGDPDRRHLRGRVGGPQRDGAADASASSVAASPPAATRAIVAVTLSTGRRVPMIPVERWSTCDRRTPSAAATASPIAAWSASPAGPVAALALPEVAMTARAYPAAASPPPVAWRLARESRTGAAAKRFGVNTAAAGTGPSVARRSARSPGGRRP